MPSLALRLIASLSILLGACLMSLPAGAGALPERVAKAAQERVADGTHQTIVFGAVDGDASEIVAFGTLDSGKAPDGDTVYEIGSITKTFTGTLLAQAVLAGRVTLDTPIAALLPGFRIPSRNGKEITLGLLATQRSGLPRLPENMEPQDVDNPYADYDAAKLKAFLAGYELSRDPGAAYEYSNLGIGLLGYALAQKAQTNFAALVEADILKPLGMTMSGVALTDVMGAHLASGHGANGQPAKNWDIDALAGAGALRSTANDMLRYLKANMGREPSALPAAMQFAQAPRSEDRTMRIGLAWMTTENGIVWHSGGTGGYRSFVGFTADRRRGVVILTNTSVEVDDLGFATLDSKTPLTPATIAGLALDDYVGTYKLAVRARDRPGGDPDLSVRTR
jgi:serine-type D-Ala-D-Ala carboxypeptidase/endopeptidase